MHGIQKDTIEFTKIFWNIVFSPVRRILWIVTNWKSIRNKVKKCNRWPIKVLKRVFCVETNHTFLLVIEVFVLIVQLLFAFGFFFVHAHLFKDISGLCHCIFSFSMSQCVVSIHIFFKFEIYIHTFFLRRYRSLLFNFTFGSV